jgi:hypothetical protein
MSLLDLHGPDTLQAAPLYLPQTPAPRRSWGAATAIFRGAGEGLLQLGASGAALLSQGASIAPGMELDAIGPAADVRAAQQRERMRDVEYIREGGRSLRPDDTASTAEQVIYGFARGAAKLIGGAVAGGVPGILGVSAEEAFTQRGEAIREGIDPDTATRLGLVQGGGLALAALPMAGQTLRATAALYLAGGPGGFVAQQALTRDILERGGYDERAEQVDILDPVGLAVSTLIPAPFAVLGLRNARRAQALQSLPDLPPGERVAGDGFRPPEAPPFEPTAAAGALREAYPREVVDAALVLHSRQRDYRAQEMAAGTDPRAAEQHVQALTRAEQQLQDGLPVQVADVAPARRIESFDEFLAKNKFPMERPPAEVRGDFLGWLRTLGGVEIESKFDITGERNAVRANPGGIFRRGGQTTDVLASQAVENGYLRPDEDNSAAFVELVQRAVRGERILKLNEQAEQAGRSAAADALGARVEDAERRLRVLGIDPTPAKGNVQAMEAYLQQREPELLGVALDDARRAADDGVNDYGLEAKARQLADDIWDSDRTVAQWEAEVAPLSPVMRSMVSRMLQQRGAQPGPALSFDAIREPALPGRAAGDAPAAAATFDPAPATQQLVADMPDLKVKPEDGAEAIPAAQFLDNVRAEAARDAQDGELLKAAVQCALINGF